MTRTELNQQTARVLARVEAGETVTITDRGAPIAELAPIRQSGWARLVATGKVIPARSEGPVDLPAAVSSTQSAAEVLDDVRRDRTS